jgi:hypothetical protein
MDDGLRTSKELDLTKAVDKIAEKVDELHA